MSVTRPRPVPPRGSELGKSGFSVRCRACTSRVTSSMVLCRPGAAGLGTVTPLMARPLTTGLQLGLKTSTKPASGVRPLAQVRDLGPTETRYGAKSLSPGV